MYHNFCIYSSDTGLYCFVEGYLDSFQLLAIVNKSAMNIVEHVSLLDVGSSFGYMPRSGIAGSSDSTMSKSFHFLWLAFEHFIKNSGMKDMESVWIRAHEWL